jgi:hypothetical protein
MKTLIKNYTFDPVAKTIQFSDKSITLDTLLVITNVTDNIIIYNFAASTKGGTMSGSTLTLTYDTSTMSATDTLQIFAVRTSYNAFCRCSWLRLVMTSHCSVSVARF